MYFYIVEVTSEEDWKMSNCWFVRCDVTYTQDTLLYKVI